MPISSTFDVTAAYAPIAARLQELDGVRAVRGANDLAQVLHGQTTGTDGYVYLIFDGIQPKSEAGNGKHQHITVAYTVIIASQTYSRDGIPEGVGKLIGGVMQALSGFSPLDDDPRSRQTLRHVAGERSAHAYGYSLYPLKYELDMVYQVLS